MILLLAAWLAANNPCAPPTTLEEKRALARLGLAYIEQNRPDDAVATLTCVADAYPEAAPWLRLRLMDLKADPIGQANRILADAPATSAATMAKVRLPGLYALAGDQAATDTAFRDAIAMPIDELSEKEFVDLASTLEKAGRADLATQIRMRLLTEYAQGRYTEELYAAVKKTNPSPLDALNVSDELALARRLAGSDHYDEALDLLDRISKRDPKAFSSNEYKTFRLRAMFNSRHYEEIVRETKKENLKDPSLILLRARAAWRDDKPKLFLADLQRIEKHYRRSIQAIEAKILRAKYYTVDEMKPWRAVDSLAQAVKAGGPGNEGETLWTLGFTQILAHRDRDALRTFDRYLRDFPDGDYRTNALFWSAKIYARQGDTAKRDAAFNELLNSYPYSYYSYRAREILKLPGVAPNEVQNGNVFPDVDAEIAALHEPRLDSIRELTLLDLTRDATAEMKSIVAAHPDSNALAFRLADLYSRGGEPFKAIGVLQRRFGNFVRHGGTAVPRRFWEILFPLKYWGVIRTEAEKRNIDPFLMASIIRQESGFESTVVSNAGAVGVMQIMPLEGPRIAAAAGLAAPSRQDLFDPSTNIAIGVAEYSQKLGVMHGTAVLGIAAYNAGEEAVGKWLAQTPIDDIDLFVETIPYSETRLYVKSVTRNRFEYRRIYEGVSSSS